MTDKPKRRNYRREINFPARINFPASAELRDALDTEAEESERPASAVARDALARGLPLIRDARRKRARRQAQQDSAE